MTAAEVTEAVGSSEAVGPPPVHVSEVRVLEGPNLFFVRPAVKITCSVPGYLAADDQQMRLLARRLGLGGVRPGAPDSEQRQRFVMRLGAHLVRRIAAGAGVLRLSVRLQTGSGRGEVVLAFPWRHRGRALALADSVEPLLRALLEDAPAVGRRALEDSVQAVLRAEPGDAPSVLRPGIPVASVTGTNGKTTTTRLMAHIAMTAGRRTAWSSTDGVLVQGEMIEPGDYSGPAGARLCLEAPGVQLAILETARGGMLLKGVGVSSNDVSVVTNVSADHLGLQGIDTVDQLAGVKAIITRITRPSGWVVLNGQDPRVWAMRTGSRARPWAFSLDPDAPALTEALMAGGRGITVLDGDIVVLGPRADPDTLIPVLDVPVTLSGLSEHNMANALAAAAASLGLGLPRTAVVEGLATFAPDPRQNPGRMNVYSVPLRPLDGDADGGSATVIVDLAHNEAGLEALLGVALGLRPPGSLVHLGLGTAGDRSDDILQALGELAGRRADRVAAVHKERYLRGRTMQGLEAQLRVGLARVGVAEIDSYDSELAGLMGLLATASDGDVVALMCHADREQLDAWIASQGGSADGAAQIRDKVVAGRGEHPAEAEIAALRRQADLTVRLAGLERLLAERPGDTRLLYELAAGHESDGSAAEAMRLLAGALEGGLREPYHSRALISQALLHRSCGQVDVAREIVERLADHRPDSATVVALRALLRVDAGEEAPAVADLVDALMAHSSDPTDEAFRPVLHELAQQLR